MKKNRDKNKAFPSTWRDLRPNSPRKPASKAAFRKRVVGLSKSFGILAATGLLGFGIWWSQILRIGEEPINLFGPGIPVKEISFETDGVLGKFWFQNWHGPLRNRSLMDINVKSLQRELEEEPQVASAKVSRIFPHTLKIELSEQQPILVLRLGKKGGGFQDWMVSSDGSLYQGTGYSRGTMSLLPSLKISSHSLRPKKEGNGFAKLEDVPVVAPLLELARREYPEIYRDWTVVSYHSPRENNPGSHVLVRSKKVRSLRFSPNNFSAQMKRLKYLLLQPEYKRRKTIESIDLSHDRSVFARL